MIAYRVDWRQQPRLDTVCLEIMRSHVRARAAGVYPVCRDAFEDMAPPARMSLATGITHVTGGLMPLLACRGQARDAADAPASERAIRSAAGP